MKRCSYFLILILAILPAAEDVFAASSSLEELIGSGPFRESWEPYRPVGSASNHIWLRASESLELEVPAGSGLRIDSPDPLDTLLIRNIYVPSLPPFTRTLIPGSPLIDTPGSIYLPGGICTGSTIRIQASGTDLNLQLFQLVTIRIPFYWQKIASAARKLLLQGDPDATFETLFVRAEAGDDFSLTGLWIRMTHAALTAADADRLTEEETTRAVEEITRMFGILAEEETYDRPFEADQRIVEIPEVEDGITSKLRQYRKVDPDCEIPVEGPAWLMLALRMSLDETPASPMVELPFDIRIDGAKTGHFPDGFCRFLTDPVNPQISGPVNIDVYIPEGSHNLSILTDFSVLIDGFERRPLYRATSNETLPFIINPLDYIPIRFHEDIEWMENQFLKGGRNPIIQRIATHFSNRFRWRFIESVSEPVLRLESNSRPIRAGAVPTETADVDPQYGLYRFPGPSPVKVHVPDTKDQFLPVINIIDPERKPGDPSPSIRINGMPFIHPDLSDPFLSARMIAIPIQPGSHEFQIESCARPVFSDCALDGIRAESLEVRRYYQCGGHDDPTDCQFPVNGGLHGAPARIYYRQQSATPIDLFLNGELLHRIVPIPGETDDSIAGPDVSIEGLDDSIAGSDISIAGTAILLIPPGQHRLTADSEKPLFFAIAQPDWMDDASGTIPHKDPFLETVLDAFGKISSDMAMTRLQASPALKTPEKALFLALAGDSSMARNVLLDAGYDETLFSHRALMAWILADTGYETRAVDTFWPLIQDPLFPYSSALFHKMLDSALLSNGFVRASIIAARIHERSDDSERSRDLLQGPPAFSNAAATDIRQLLCSAAPRWLPVPSGHVECQTVTTRLLDQWRDPTPKVDRDPTLFWLMQSGESMQFELPVPAAIRLIIRRPAADATDSEAANSETAAPLDLIVSYPSVRAKLSIPAVGADRETLKWENLSTVPGQPVEIVLPVPEPGTVTVECISGCAAIKPWIQVVSPADLLTKSASESDSEIPDQLIADYNRILNNGERSEPDCARQYAEAAKLHQQYPSCHPVSALLDLLESNLEWKLVSGWPENTGDRSYLAARRLTGDPIVSIRALDIPEPDISDQSHLLTQGRQLTLDPGDFPPGTLKFEATFHPSTDFVILVESNLRGIYSLTPENPALNLEWSSSNGDSIKIIAETVTGKFPVKLAAVHHLAGKTVPVPLAGNRRYHHIRPVTSAGLSGNIIGPCCLRLELRNAEPGVIDRTVTIQTENQGSLETSQQTIEIPSDADEDYFDAVTGKPVGKSVEAIVPLIEAGIHRLTVTAGGKSGTPVLARCYAVRHSHTDNRHRDKPCGYEILSETALEETRAPSTPDAVPGSAIVWTPIDWNSEPMEIRN